MTDPCPYDLPIEPADVAEALGEAEVADRYGYSLPPLLRVREEEDEA